MCKGVPERMQGETRISIQALAKREDVAGSTVSGWWRRGAYGAHLDTFLIGGIRYTTEEEFQRFIEA